MSEIRDGLLYTKEDEWIKVDGDIVTLGITDYAQNSLSDIVYLELPGEGDTFSAEESFGVVESVKAAADLYTPIDLEITAVNEELMDAPEALNEKPFESWLIKAKVSDGDQLAAMMDADAYRAYCDERD